MLKKIHNPTLLQPTFSNSPPPPPDSCFDHQGTIGTKLTRSLQDQIFAFLTGSLERIQYPLLLFNYAPDV